MMIESTWTTADAELWPHLMGLSIPRACTDQVTLLIGLDNPEALAPLLTILRRRNKPYTVKTCLGWTLHGMLKDTHEESSAHTYFVSDLDTVHWDMER